MSIDSTFHAETLTRFVEDQPIRVILIGGTSHMGKSTLAEAWAAQLGWSHRSTDWLARHPGRPWRTRPKSAGDFLRSFSRTVLSPD